MRRRDFLAVIGVAAAFPRSAFAQQSKTKRLGILFHLAPDDPQVKLLLDAIWAGLGKYGWTDKTLFVDNRFNANAVDVALEPASELIALSPDVLFATTTPSITALARLAPTIPIVFSFVTGSTLSQLLNIQDYAHPAGHITGFSNQDDQATFGKRVDILREMGLPISTVALIYGQTAVPGGEQVFLAQIRSIAAQQNVALTPYPVTTPAQITNAIQDIKTAFATDPTIGVAVNGDSFIGANRVQAATEMVKSGLIAVWSGSQTFADAGALITYAADPIPSYRGAGEYVGLILNGAKPSDLPIQVVSQQLTINLKTAAAEGVTIPASIMSVADRVIQ